ncbi:GNAT family N-acetyltransferase [Belliella sp. DSM 111904]|uniref:GNAT family N-acetyltransferase n=1 Tax=Belliella filtrata TaxID=2923435 RepID=A0ABS9V4K8_9BACT|nr:GNAT family protein [Belliella filtrata]MCH7411319.1 GNAT family N-acetyltransferase [Belliella filtrata]
MHRVIIKCGHENFPSRKIPEKLGFKLSQIESKGEQMANGEWVDLIHYILKREEYQ